MKATSTKWHVQREYWKKRHIDAPFPRRAKRVLMSLSTCRIAGGPIHLVHLNVEKRGTFYLCLDCGKVTSSNRPKPKKSMRPHC